MVHWDGGGGGAGVGGRGFERGRPGVLGAAGAAPEYVRRRAAQVRELTGRPFGVNFIIDEEDPSRCGPVSPALWSMTSSKPAAQIVRDLVAEAEAALGQSPDPASSG